MFTSTFLGGGSKLVLTGTSLSINNSTTKASILRSSLYFIHIFIYSFKNYLLFYTFVLFDFFTFFSFKKIKIGSCKDALNPWELKAGPSLSYPSGVLGVNALIIQRNYRRQGT